jgi:hypothetical protein
MRFGAELWRYPGEAAWYFVTVPVAFSEAIRERSATGRAGFGSVKVQASISSSTWSTSVFPDAASGCFVLPVKKAIRRAERIDDGDVVTVTLRLADVP